MSLDGLLGEEQATADPPVRLAIGHEVGDLPLARTQRREATLAGARAARGRTAAPAQSAQLQGAGRAPGLGTGRGEDHLGPLQVFDRAAPITARGPHPTRGEQHQGLLQHRRGALEPAGARPPGRCWRRRAPPQPGRPRPGCARRQRAPTVNLSRRPRRRPRGGARSRGPRGPGPRRRALRVPPLAPSGTTFGSSLPPKPVSISCWARWACPASSRTMAAVHSGSASPRKPLGSPSCTASASSTAATASALRPSQRSTRAWPRSVRQIACG